MKILVLGNCQARPVSQFLGLATGATMLEPVVLHLARPEEEPTHETRMRDADLIVAQATQDAFSPAHVASSGIRARHAGKVLVWPNLFYAGQQPWLRYVTHARLGRILGPLDTYHDLRILGDWYQARTGHNPLPVINPDAVTRCALDDLRLREANCDVIVSDLIEAEAHRRPLFFTFNHPANWLLHRLVQRICDRAGLIPRPFTPPEQEPLARIVPPSLWHGPDSSFPLQGLLPDLQQSGVHLPDPPERLDMSQLRDWSFACYDRQAEALQDHANLRLTPHMPTMPASEGSVPAVGVSARETILVETENLVCILHDRGGDQLVMTFAGSGLRPQRNRVWAEKPLEKLGCSVLGFVAKAPNWYPQRDMQRAIDHLANDPALQGFKKRLGYGSSMGGYALLRYGKALQLDMAFVLAPQCSIDPADITDPRFNKFFNPALHPAMKLQPQDIDFPVVAVFDPLDVVDNAHMREIACSGEVMPLPVRNAGHVVAELVAGTVRLARVLHNLASGNLAGLRHDIQHWRRSAVTRPLRVALQASKRHKATALRIFKTRCAATDPGGWANILLPLCQAGYGAQLQDEMRRALEKTPENHVLLLAHAVACRQAGDEDRAMEYARHAHRLHPGQFSTFFLERHGKAAGRTPARPEQPTPIPAPIENLCRNVMLYWADDTPPPSVRDVVGQWQEIYADWTVTLFSHASAGAWLQDRCGVEIARLFRKCRLPAMQADFFRVFWAIEEGGIYSDITLAPLVCPGFAATGKDLVVMRRFHGRIVNSIFYARKGSADLKQVAYHILQAMSLQTDQNVWSATGPGAWIAALGQEETTTLGIIPDQEMYETYVKRSMYQASTRGSSQHWSQDQLTASIYLG